MKFTIYWAYILLLECSRIFQIKYDFFKNLLLLEIVLQNDYIVMISKKGTTKIVDFITSKAGGSEAWLYCLYSENALITLKSLLLVIYQAN